MFSPWSNYVEVAIRVLVVLCQIYHNLNDCFILSFLDLAFKNGTVWIMCTASVLWTGSSHQKPY